MKPQNKLLLSDQHLKVEEGAHIIYLYEDETELLDIFSRFYTQGLINNDLCITIDSDDGFSKRLIEDIEAKSGMDMNQLKSKIMHISHKDFYFNNGAFNANRVFGVVDDLISKNVLTIRCAGTSGWIDKTFFNEFCEYETAFTKRYHNNNVLVLCAYSLKQLDVAQIIKLIQSHTLILFKEGHSWKISETVERKIYNQQIEDLENFTKFAVDRELKMIDLKKRITQLEKEADDYKKSAE
ncbi:MAG: MEDS domain-containing protein [Nanoarchaeota archaeon]